MNHYEGEARMEQSRADKQKAEHRYHQHRNAPIWKIMQLENDGALDWRFRPEYVKRRMRQEMNGLVKRTRIAGREVYIHNGE